MRRVAGAAAVTLLGLLSGCGATAVPPIGRAGPAEGGRTAESAAASPLTPPPGRRWVGMNDVVVAVPTGWATERDLCVDLDHDAVRVLAGRESGCIARPGPDISALTIAPVSSGMVRLGRRTDLTTEIHGVPVIHSGVACRASSTGPCTLTFAVPDADAAFVVTYRGRQPERFIERMLESVTRLPAGQTTVPAVGFGRDVTDALRILERAGLEGRSPDPDWPHYATGTEPAAGSVVATGSTVMLTVGDG